MERLLIFPTHTGWKRQTGRRHAETVMHPSVPRPNCDGPRWSARRARPVKSAIKMVFVAGVVVVSGAACSPVAVARRRRSLLRPWPLRRSSLRRRLLPCLRSLHRLNRVQALNRCGSRLPGTDITPTPGLSPQASERVGRASARGRTTSVRHGEDRHRQRVSRSSSALVDDTFKDPCRHLERSPQLGSSVAALATALGQIPETTSTEPAQTTLAGLQSTYLEIGVPASLPCSPDEFYLWQDSPNGDWWVQGLNETVAVWILEVGGQRLVVATHSYPGSDPAAKAELQGILDSIEFDTAPVQSSPTPAAS